MTYVEAILKVLVVGLVLGAGLPALFATGMVAFSNGAGGEHSDGTVTASNPVLKYLGLALFALVALVILVALLWITRTTLIHHFGFDPFPGVKKG
jgi:NO-binding membrane sensor protein with MHYT domain